MENKTLMTDFYELTMAQTYFMEGKAEEEVYFDVFFRKNPFEGGYTVSAGLDETIKYIKNFHFGDEEIAAHILSEGNTKSPDPMTCKSLGRWVKNYDDKKWDLVRYSFMYEVNFCKYKQDKELQAKLLDPKFDNKTFVEASPTDKIWGIGRGENYPDIDDETKWLGRNLLGKAITAVRKTLIHDR